MSPNEYAEYVRELRMIAGRLDEEWGIAGIKVRGAADLIQRVTATAENGSIEDVRDLLKKWPIGVPSRHREPLQDRHFLGGDVFALTVISINCW